MSSAVFASYVEEHADLCAAAGRAIAALREQSGASRRSLQAEAEDSLAKAEEVVQQMELEARSSGKGPDARELQSQAKARRSEVTSLRSSLRQAAASLPRSELLGSGGTSSGDECNDDQRARLLRMGDRLQDGTAKLQAAHRTVLETETMGQNILGDLRTQRETIMHATGTLQRANEGLARSKRTLQQISRRALGNKMLMWFMIFMLSGGVLLLMYAQIFGLGGGAASPPPPPPLNLPPPPSPPLNKSGR